MKKSSTRDLALIGMYGALTVVLKVVSGMIPFLQMPQGGEISLAFIPAFLASYQMGWKKGLCTGILGWLIGCLFGFNSWYLNPLQYAFDYILPACVVGLASGFPKLGKVSNVFTGIICTMVLVYVCNLLSGVYFWFPEGEVAGSAAAWTYSLGYNLWYNLATCVVSAILVPLLMGALKGSKVVSFPFVKE